MKATATVSSKGQIAIPKAVRDRLNLKAGTKLAIDVQGQVLTMKRVVPEYSDWRTMEGMSKGPGSLTKALEEERAAENAHYERRIRQSRWVVGNGRVDSARAVSTAGPAIPA